MSMYPFSIDFERPLGRVPRRVMEQYHGLPPQDYLNLLVMHQALGTDAYGRPWRHSNAASQDVGSTIKQHKDKFQVNIDVQHFKADEITVKTVDGFLVVEAKHDERADSHGFVSRNFTRRYPLPEGVNPDLVASKLSLDGVLTVTAPLKAPPKDSEERVVPIVQTGPVRKQMKEGGEEK